MQSCGISHRRQSARLGVLTDDRERRQHHAGADPAPDFCLLLEANICGPAAHALALDEQRGRGKSRTPLSPSEMGLLRAYSNHDVQVRLRQLSEKLDQVVASSAERRVSARSDRRLRGGLVPKAIERILGEAGEPMRACNIHAAVDRVARADGASFVGQELAGEECSGRRSSR
jgi:hypothetical protein